jgi:hypothetical protein
VALFELPHLIQRPGVESFGARPEIFNITSRIVWGKFFLHSEFEDLPHCLDAGIC